MDAFQKLPCVLDPFAQELQTQTDILKEDILNLRIKYGEDYSVIFDEIEHAVARFDTAIQKSEYYREHYVCKEYHFFQ